MPIFSLQIELSQDSTNGKFSICNESELNESRKLNQLPCAVDLSVLEECNTFPYGYAGENPEPCFVIKVNKIFGFTPQALTAGDAEKMNNTVLPQAVNEI